MAQKIVIAELDLNIESLIKSTSDVKKSIDDLKTKQKELTAAGDTASNAFVQNAADLKILQGAYNQNIKAIADTTQATADAANKTQLMNLALTTEVTSINEARAANALLSKVRNDVNVNTAEGQAELTKLNTKIDENNKFINKNSDELSKQKINVGNYQSALSGLDGILAKFGVSGQEARNVVQGFSSTVSKGADDLLNFTSSAGAAVGKLIGFKTSSQLAAEQQLITNAATTGGAVANETLALSQEATATATTATTLSLKGFTLALAATGIGLLVIGVGLLVNYFKDFDPLLDKIERGFAALGAVVSVVTNAFVSLFSSSENNAQSFDNLGKKISNAADAAAKLKGAQQALEDVQRTSVLTNAQLATQADLALIQSKDKTKTDGQRIGLLKEAESLEQRRFKINEANAINDAILTRQGIELKLIQKGFGDREIQQLKDKGVAYANYLLQTGIINQKELENFISKETAVEAVRQESNKKIEKNINSQNKLIEDQQAVNEKNIAANKKADEDRAAAAQKRLDDLVSIASNEAEFYKQTNRFKEDDLQKAKDFATKDIEVLKAKLTAKQLTQAEFDTAELTIKNNLQEKSTEIDNVALDKTKDFEAREKQLKNEIEIQNTEDEAVKQALALTQKLDRDLQEITDLEISITQKNELKKLLADKYNNDIADITEKGAAREAKIKADAAVAEINYNKTKNEALLNIATQLTRQLLGLLGDSVGAQIAAIAVDAVLQIAKLNIATSAASAINTANGAALSIPTLGASVVAATVQNGILFANSKLQSGLILASATLAAGTKIMGGKFAGGGFIEAEGASHAQGGIPIQIGGQNFGTMQGGEGLAIMNKGAFSQFKAFNQTFGDSDVNKNSPSGFMAGGGIITTAIGNNQIDFSEVVNLLSNMPTPIVSVQDIINETNNRVNIVDYANS